MIKNLTGIILLSTLFSCSSADSENPALIASKELETKKETTTSPKRIALKTGVEIEYVEQGKPDGIPVVFLHGISDSWRSFETTLPHLPASIHAFALSQRGHGDSDRPDDAYTPRHFAADLAAFIEQKSLGPVIVVGHSMGGIIVQQFALDYPNLVKAVVIISSDAAIAQNPGVPEFQNQIMQMDDSPNREFMTGFQMSTVANPIDSVYFNRLVDEAMKVPMTVFKSVMRGFFDVDHTSRLKNLDKRVLVLWGDKDQVFQREGQQKLLSNLKSARWVVYEGIGHALHWEQPERFAKDITSFVNEVEPVSKK